MFKGKNICFLIIQRSSLLGLNKGHNRALICENVEVLKREDDFEGGPTPQDLFLSLCSGDVSNVQQKLLWCHVED